MPLSIAILAFNAVEVLDLAGPYEVFTTASRMHARINADTSALFHVFTIGQAREPISARAGLSLFPDHGFDAHPTIDVLIVPGGVVTTELGKPEVIQWIQNTAKQCQIAASVCTGAFLLAKAGLLAGKTATTHWEDIEEFKSQHPDVVVKNGVRWVDAGHIVTSAGISAGIDMSLHLVERLAGRELAQRTAQQMDFDWTENP